MKIICTTVCPLRWMAALNDTKCMVKCTCRVEIGSLLEAVSSCTLVDSVDNQNVVFNCEFPQIIPGCRIFFHLYKRSDEEYRRHGFNLISTNLVYHQVLGVVHFVKLQQAIRKWGLAILLLLGNFRGRCGPVLSGFLISEQTSGPGYNSSFVFMKASVHS